MKLKQSILLAAVALAKKQGFRNIRRREICANASAANGTINYHFGDMDGLRDEVMRHAIDAEILEIVAQGLTENHKLVMRASEALRRRAARNLVG